MSARNQPATDQPLIADADPEGLRPGASSLTLLQAITGNIFTEGARDFGAIAPGGTIDPDLTAFINRLQARNPIVGTTGTIHPEPLLQDPDVGDLLVGRDAAGRHLHAAFSFLRIAKTTFAASQTCIDELRAWQSEGPFTRDRWGRSL